MMPHCQVCGKQLDLRHTLRTFIPSRKFTYPFRRADGARVEEPVRWLCSRCIRHARRVRERQAGLETSVQSAR